MVTVILIFYENQLFKKLNTGKVSYTSFYENKEEVESPPSSEDEDTSTPRWCTVRKDFRVGQYGKASGYIGLRFSKKKGSATILITFISFILIILF